MESPAPALTTFRNAQEPKLTLKVLAEQLGITEGHLSRIEREGTVNFKLALKLAGLTKLPVETFAPKSDAAADEAA